MSFVLFPLSCLNPNVLAIFEISRWKRSAPEVTGVFQLLVFGPDFQRSASSAINFGRELPSSVLALWQTSFVVHLPKVDLHDPGEWTSRMCSRSLAVEDLLKADPSSFLLRPIYPQGGFGRSCWTARFRQLLVFCIPFFRMSRVPAKQRSFPSLKGV